MKVATIIQARMGSTRLPGKVLKTVLGKTLLEYQIERVKVAQTIEQIIIATTMKEIDEPIVNLCERLGVDYFRGSEHDVLSRYFETATNFNIDVIVRITSDCPLIDPEIIDKVVSHYLNHREKLDYASNTLERTYPRGLDTEVFSYNALKRANDNAFLDRDREHVTPYFYTNPTIFRLSSIKQDIDMSMYRWTVDTKEDFELVHNILTALYPVNPLFKTQDVISLLNQYPEWNDMNASVEQKQL